MIYWIINKLPVLTFSALNTAFDEKSLFPRYILDYEIKMKQFHTKSLQETGVSISHEKNTQINMFKKITTDMQDFFKSIESLLKHR